MTGSMIRPPKFVLARGKTGSMTSMNVRTSVNSADVRVKTGKTEFHQLEASTTAHWPVMEVRGRTCWDGGPMEKPLKVKTVLRRGQEALYGVSTGVTYGALAIRIEAAAREQYCATRLSAKSVGTLVRVQCFKRLRENKGVKVTSRLLGG